MKWYLLIILIILFSATSAQKLNYEVKDINNNWVELSALTGERYTVVDFWATWCKPCVNALPKINQMNNTFYGNGVKFIGVNVDGPRNQAKVKPFVSSLELVYSIVLDPDQEIMNDMNVSVLPTIIILDNNQKEVFRHEGFHQGDEKIIELKLLDLYSK